MTISDNSGNSSNSNAIVTVQTESLGIDNINFNHIKVYPNPFDNFIIIEMGELFNFKIQVFDIRGRLVYDKESVNPTNNKTTINNFKLEQGSYFIKIINIENGQFSIKKLIKQ